MLSHTATPRTPTILYAQDKNQIFLTIDLQDVHEHELVKGDSQISFKTIKDNVPYEFNLELFSKVDEKSWTVSKTNRNIALVAQKQDKNSSFWPRLNKTGKLSYIKTDFSKWKDEDDDEEEEPMMQGGGGMSDQLMQMMGAGQLSPDMLSGMMGGDAASPESGAGMTNVNFEEVDSDDEELPPLEENSSQP